MTAEHLQRIDHVGIVVDDLDAAVAFFVALGLTCQGEGRVEGRWVDRVIGLDGTQVDMAMLKSPDGLGALELIKFHAPAAPDGARAEAANVPGLRHIAFAVDDIDAVVAGLAAHGGELIGEVVRYGDSWRLCYLRGPQGIIVELAEKIG
jgi:catechol 2,3-dioxygenase-like lactoylglutathione lyase family enzyme